MLAMILHLYILYAWPKARYHWVFANHGFDATIGCPGEAPASAAAALAAAAERGHAKVVSTLRCLDLPRTMKKQ